MKFTRRTLLGSVAGAAALAQTPPPPSPEPADQNKVNADAIAKVALPQSTEPAFAFRA
ncbi:MAG: hypothetical protein JWO80_1223 [Bryobacterales bacterium]|nr:hypothetical protein [Bryobacterales bacterium]